MSLLRIRTLLRAAVLLVAAAAITGCMDGWRVWLFGRPYRDTPSATIAARIAAALTTLDALDALPPGLKPTETV